MKQLVIETISRMIKERQDARKEPSHILYFNLKRELAPIDTSALKIILRELWEEKVIKAGQTINDTYIKINPNGI
jgi:hypothetical protein